MADVISCDIRDNQGQALIFPEITKKAQAFILVTKQLKLTENKICLQL